MDLQNAYKTNHYTRTRSGILVPGPGHSSTDRSLSVTFKADAPDGFLVHSFAGDNPIECRNYVRGLLSETWQSKLQKPVVSKKNDHAEQRTQQAKKIFDEARPAFGSAVEAYLAGRGLAMVPEASVLRFHPACPFAGDKVAAMVAPVVNIKTNAFQAIHRTRLNPKKKMMFGPVGAGCLKLSPDEDVHEGLHICEGIETGLALLEAGFRPIWPCLFAGGIATFPVLSGIESLTIFADNDENRAGEKAAAECARRWQDAGRDVRIMAPRISDTDFADRGVA